MQFTFIEEEPLVEKVQRDYVDLEQYLQENPLIPEKSSCMDCPAFEKMNMLPVQGKGKRGIMVVLSHPTKGDIDMGSYSVSQAFVHTQKHLAKFGIDIHEDCWVTSAVRCNAGGQIPANKTFEACRPKLRDTVVAKKPFVVFLVGRNAMYGWKGHQFSTPPRAPDYSDWKHDIGYTKWVGQQIPDAEYAFDYNGESMRPVVIPLFNPHDVAQAENNNMKRNNISSVIPSRHSRIIDNGIQLAARIQANIPKHIQNQKKLYAKHSKYRKVTDVKECVTILNGLNSRPIIAFDYETTGLKPFNHGHAITMVGIADGETSYAMPFFDRSPEFLEAYKRLMTNPKVRKVAHNFKFEYVWTRTLLGYEVEPVYWDTMIAAHILDMRDGIIGLKMQGYLRYGDAGYEKVTKKLLGAKVKTARRNSNALNWLSELDPYALDENTVVWDKLLEYVAQDASLTLAIYYDQRKEFAMTDMEHLMKGMDLLMKSTTTLADMECNGFVLDAEALKENKKEIKNRMAVLKEEMFASAEYAKWKERYPDKELNFKSSKQLQELFFDILGYKPTRFTKTKAASTDKEALEGIDSEFAVQLLKYKELGKLSNDFLTGYQNEQNDDGMIRTMFNLCGAKSYRTSSSSINIQQVSHHSEESHYVLNVLKPNKGHVMLNVDFKSLEVFVSAAHTWAVHDPNNPSLEGTLKRYLVDESADMHRDIASMVYFFSPEEITKDLRNRSKKVTFGATYGSMHKSLAHNQWKDCTPEDKAHLAENGIKNYEDFTQHMYNIWWDFWNVRFYEYMIWKKRVWAFYVKYGYFIGLTGFMYTAPDLDDRKTSNFGIQGDASHILLYLANEMHDFLKANNMESLQIAQVHDSLMFSAAPEEVPAILERIRQFLDELDVIYPWTKGFDFVVEAEQSEIDGTWGSVQEFAKIRRNVIEYSEEYLEALDKAENM